MFHGFILEYQISIKKTSLLTLSRRSSLSRAAAAAAAAAALFSVHLRCDIISDGISKENDFCCFEKILNFLQHIT
jgi:hypothetical protein